ncbi:S1 family peptidase [Actinoallomurus spadix]|nr:S1 family peptidase [Actinoallomurus spadix]MCO5988449.1 S1 family peptidase [Actinoallomurus spadix]
MARGRDRGKVLGILSAISGDCASSGAWFQPITEPLGRYGVSVY